MRKNPRIAILIVFVLSVSFITPNTWAVVPIRNIQIDVISISTPFGTETVTTTNSKTLIDKVNAGFDDISGGLIHFTLRTVLSPITVSTPVISPGDVGKIAGSISKPDPGFEQVVLIGVIPRNPNIKFAGIAGGDLMLINGDWSPENANTIAHELGHNMGLLHANATVCTNVLPIICEQVEYGDYSSVMGTNVSGYPSTTYVARFSATELDKLRVLEASKRMIAYDTGEYKLAPVYSKSLNSPTLLYIPIGNEMIYSVEYRPAIGADSGLAKSQLPALQSYWYYRNIPSYGIQLRILQAKGKEFNNLIPKFNYSEHFETALLVDSFTSPQVQPIGKTLNLSDGSTLTLISEDPNMGAVVKIYRPLDKQAPTFPKEIATWEPSVYWLAANGDRLIKKKNPNEWEFPALEIPLDGILDNRLVKKVVLEVNGKPVQEVIDVQLLSKRILRYQTTDAGVYKLRLIATDTSGNVGASDISTFTTSYYKLTSPGVVANAGQDPFTSLKFSFYKIGTDTTYKLTDLSSGSVQSEEEVNGITTFTIINITRNSNFSAKLTGSNPAGYTDGGQIIVGTPRKYEIRPPSVQVTLGDDPFTMLNFRFYSSCTTCNYSLTNLTTGVVKSKEIKDGITTIVVSDIRRNQTLRATLTGNDAYGFSDGGQEVVGQTSLYAIRPPQVAYSYGNDPRTSLVVTFKDACESCTYVISNLTNGIVAKTEKINDQNLITISNISRNSGFKATLIGNDAYGFSDSGQEISENVQESVCDNSLCYQGMDWVVATGYWTSGTGNMSLQELVKGKWVTVKAAKPIPANNDLLKFPNTYAITIKNVSIGKRTYRLSISAKGKYSAYVGKSFVQVVKP